MKASSGSGLCPTRINCLVAFKMQSLSCDGFTIASYQELPASPTGRSLRLERNPGRSGLFVARAESCRTRSGGCRFLAVAAQLVANHLPRLPLVIEQLQHLGECGRIGLDL